jgi:hypothetical protein
VVMPADGLYLCRHTIPDDPAQCLRTLRTYLSTNHYFYPLEVFISILGSLNPKMLSNGDLQSLYQTQTMDSGALGTSTVRLPQGRPSDHPADGQPIWIDELLLLCDEARRSLWTTQTFGPQREQIMAMLGEAIKGECNMGPRVGLRLSRSQDRTSCLKICWTLPTIQL